MKLKQLTVPDHDANSRRDVSAWKINCPPALIQVEKRKGRLYLICNVLKGVRIIHRYGSPIGPLNRTSGIEFESRNFTIPKL